MAKRITIVEVGPRDGLQNEKAAVSTADKIEFINRLRPRACRSIEVSAFVSPKWVPQMADAADVFAGSRGARHALLGARPESHGPRPRAAGAGHRNRRLRRATETFSRKNINQSIDESLATYRRSASIARAAGLRTRGYLSTAFGCPYEGTSIRTKRRMSRRGWSISACSRWRSATRSAMATPEQVPRVLDAVLGAHSHREGRAAFSRHARDGARQRAGRTPFGVATFDASAGRTGRMSVRSRGARESGHERADSAVGRNEDRDGRVAREAHRSVAFIRSKL
jgi:hydroxymethylglutaryl-CoA lyase